MRNLLTLMAALCSFCLSAQTTYTNPVYNKDFPDPSVQRAQDGVWYAYATGQRGLTSQNLYEWNSISNVISRPTWNDSTYVKDGQQTTDYYSFWACDVNYVDGQYLMLYACALWGNGSRTGIGVATGKEPGKFTDKGKLFRSTEIGVNNSIDPCYVEEFDKKYIVWGSFNDIYVSELSEDGLSVKNPKAKTKIGGGAFEGAMIYKRGSYYYLFASVGSCCNGFESTYRTVVGRATKLTGPYKNKQGGTMFDNNYTTIIKGNDRWKGPGHNSEIVTDDDGNDWLLYHAYDTKGSESNRVMLLDKITWDKDDWPVINDGTPSSTPQPVPVFYSGDGSVRTYRIQNPDFAKSQWRGWTVNEADGVTASSGLGTAFMPVGYVKGAGSFDISQTLTGMTNGLYEVEMNAEDSEENVDFCLNGLPTPVHDSTYTGTYPATDASAASYFLRGRFRTKAYGLVYDGKLTLQMRSRNPLAANERFYIGNLKLVYRQMNEEVMQSVIGKYDAMKETIYGSGAPFYNSWRTAIDNARTDYDEATTANTRYNQLVAYVKAIDKMKNSIEVYDSLSRHITLLQEKIEQARQGGYLTEAATNVLNEAQEVIVNQDYTDLNVQKLITRMITEGDGMVYTYQQGDGTAENPYVITRPEQALNMSNVLVKTQTTYFVLDNDIDMDAYEWKQVCSSSSQRTYINFDGRGHLIENLHIGPATGYPSFFGTLAGECRNVGFVNAEVTNTGTGAGIIAGFMGMATYKDDEGNPLSCIIENCYVTGRVEGKDFAGAVAGTIGNSPVIIRNVYANAEVVSNGSTSNYAGGMVGRVRSGLTIENCYSAGTAQGLFAAPISGGGHNTTTAASTFNNVIAWSQKVDGTKMASPFAITAENDVLTNTFFFRDILVNGETAEGGKTHAELQQQAAKWGTSWYADPAAGNGYPILQWQYDRGDYRQKCGFPIVDAIHGIATDRQQPTTIYDLSGRKMERRSLSPGIYIVNGRKVIY